MRWESVNSHAPQESRCANTGRLQIVCAVERFARGRRANTVTEPMVIRKILLHVQSRAPSGGGSGGEHHPNADTTFTLAG